MLGSSFSWSCESTNSESSHPKAKGKRSSVNTTFVSFQVTAIAKRDPYTNSRDVGYALEHIEYSFLISHD